MYELNSVITAICVEIIKGLVEANKNYSGCIKGIISLDITISGMTEEGFCSMADIAFENNKISIKGIPIVISDSTNHSVDNG